MIIDLEQDYKDRIEAIWNKQIELYPETKENEIIKLGYAIERELTTGGVLFLGMNPSYRPGEWNNNGGGFYAIEPKNAFFQAIINFCQSELKIDYVSHHDILFVRHTNQKDIENLMQQRNYRVFFKEQLELSRDIIRATSPELIVVLNARVREVFKKMFPSDYDNSFDEELGAYIVDIGKEIPVVFSGMLSGQRALDLGSKRTLQWQIQRIMKRVVSVNE